MLRQKEVGERRRKGRQKEMCNQVKREGKALEKQKRKMKECLQTTNQHHKRGKKQTEKRRTWIETEKESKTGKNRLTPQWEKSVKETKRLAKQIN